MDETFQNPESQDLRHESASPAAPPRPVRLPRPRWMAALAGSLDALDQGEEGGCVVCGGEAFPVVRRSGVIAQVCRECGSSLERPPVDVGRSRRAA